MSKLLLLGINREKELLKLLNTTTDYADEAVIAIKKLLKQNYE